MYHHCPTWVNSINDTCPVPAFEKGRASRTANLDFDARVPIPFSVFPSSYRSDAVSETTQSRVEEEVKVSGASRVGREDTRYEGPLPEPKTSYRQEEAETHVQDYYRPSRQQEETFYEEDRQRSSRYPEVELSRERYYDNQGNQGRQEFESQLDVTEREYRQRTDPRFETQYESAPRYTRDVDVSYDRAYESVESARPRQQVRDVDYEATQYPPNVESYASKRTTFEEAPARKMGYYDDDGNYHSFRRGVERAADRIRHPFHHSGGREDEVEAREQGPTRVREGVRENVRVVQPRHGHPKDTITIPCHFIRIGDLLILQGRPCQVIRVSVSPQTGQHRYLGVDLFTRQLHEESSFISNPSPSVVVQSMLGPIYKTYRILDLHDDGHIVAMTETGDVKQGIRVVDQGGLFGRISDAFGEGRGSVRALVINDGGRELVVDYKVIHGSRL